MRTRMIFLVAGLILAAVMIGCSAGESKEKPATPVRVKPVETHLSTSAVRYSASIRPAAQVDVAFKVGGYIDAIAQVRDAAGQSRSIQAGDIVRKGTVLARVRQSDYSARVNEAKSQQGEARSALDSARAQENEATANIETSRAQLSDAQAYFDRVKLDFERAKALFSTQSITKPDYDAAKGQFEIAQAKLDAAKSQLKVSEARVVTARAQIGAAESRIRTAEASTVSAGIPLQDTKLIAPMTGVVIERRIEIGTLVSQGVTGFVLADLAFVKAAFGVSDLALRNLKLGDTLHLTSDAVPGNEFSGHISRIAPSADQNSRVFDVEVTIPNPEGLLKPGMIAALNVDEGGGAHSEVAVVPLTAVTRSKENPSAYAVFVVEQADGKQRARLRVVTLGESFGNAIAATNGVKAGELVIITGGSQVADGEHVTVIP